MDKNYKKNELAKKILLMTIKIVGAATFLTVAMIAPGAVQAVRLFEIGNKTKVKKAINRLQKQKLIEIFGKDEEEIVKITERGKQKILKYKFDEMKMCRPKKWDGFWRIIAFDIPEKHKKARDALRMKLKELGFFKLQDSVFVFPFHCKNEIDFIAEIFSIRKYINYIEAKTVENDWELKNHFHV